MKDLQEKYDKRMAEFGRLFKQPNLNRKQIEEMRAEILQLQAELNTVRQK